MPNVAAVQSDAGPQQIAQAAPASHHLSFHDVLSALNPLQYLPVIGTIYRAVTGDEIPEPVRRIGSLFVSALMGGPIGAAINVAIMVAEKITGIDLDRTGQTLLTGNAPAAPLANQSAPALTPEPASPTDAVAAPAASPLRVWSPAERKAYGIGSAQDAAGAANDVGGADVFNALELLRIRGARDAYGRTSSLAG